MKNSFLKYAVLLFSILLLLATNTCKKSTTSSENGTGVKVVLTSTEIAQKFQTLFNVPITSTVTFTGPVEPGTRIVENDLEGIPVELELPDTEGTYYVFIIDDEPEMRFAHNMRYAWIDIGTDAINSTDAYWPGIIMRPNINPAPFSLVESITLNGVNYSYVQGEGQPEVGDFSHKNEEENLAKITITYFNPQRAPVKIAYVLDAGELSGNDRFHDLETTTIAGWVGNESNDFEVHHISQDASNSLPYFPSGSQMNENIKSWGDWFTSLGEPDYGCDEYFLYIGAHGAKDVGGFGLTLFGVSELVLYRSIFESIQSTFPSYVKVTIFIDACYSGRAISDNEAIIQTLCDQLCAVTVLTSCKDDVPTTCPVEGGIVSGTQMFNAGENLDHDGDGKIGDIKDRFSEMEGRASGSNRGPQSFHCPEGGSWCSLDGPTYCESQEILYNLMGFFSHYFVEEPCSAVELPPDDRTVTNSWGLIKDIMYSMVNTYGKGIIRKDIPPELLYTIAFDYPFNDQGIYVGPSPHNYKLNGSNILYSSDAYIILFNVMHDNIPIADPVYYYQYGFVFDRDGNTNNNYQPHPSYPYDFFQDTDYWVVASYAPGLGWYLDVSDATNSVVTSVESEAKIIIVENTLIVLIPRSEFLAQNIGYRVTAYKHPGDWGMTSGDWDGDVQPPVVDGPKLMDIGPE